MDIHTFTDSLDCENQSPSSRQRKILFPLGQIVATPGALKLLSRHSLSPMMFIERHATGDWGCLCPEDALENERAVNNGCRILSAYEIAGKHRIWVVTEWNRSVTTLLRPEDY